MSEEILNRAGEAFSPEDESQILDVIGRWLERDVVDKVMALEAADEYPHEMVERMKEFGLFGATIAQEYGGLGLPAATYAKIVTTISEVWMSLTGIFNSHLIMAAAVERFGTEEQKRRFLPRFATGELRGALALTEPNCGTDLQAIRTKAVRDGDDWLINGSKIFISNGSIADFVTTACRTGGAGSGGISLIVVPTQTPGFRTGRRLRKLGTHAADTAELFFEDCRVPGGNLVGEENRGFRLIMQGFEGERLVIAVMATAQMRLMWEEARRYGHERHAFGRSLLGFQVWRHRLADVRTKIEAAHECAQIFGGMGYMEESLIARLHRDTLAFTVGAGTSEMMREIIASSCGLTGQAA